MKKAFTLVELVTCISIAVLIVAILIPVIIVAKAKAKTSVCLSNQRQAAIALKMYAEDNDGNLPTMESMETGVGFLENNYQPESMGCPIAKAGERGMKGYAINNQILPDFPMGPHTNADGALLVFLCESLKGVAWTASFFPQINSGERDWMIHRQSEELKNDIGVNRHMGGSNVIFWDGHSKFFHPEGWYEAANNPHFSTF